MKNNANIDELITQGIQGYNEKDKKAHEEFNTGLENLFQYKKYQEAVAVFAGVLEEVKDAAILYYNGANACENLANKLKGDYFKKKKTVLMDPAEWIVGAGTPYDECIDLWQRAAGYLEKVIELETDLSENQISKLRDRIDDLMF